MRRTLQWGAVALCALTVAGCGGGAGGGETTIAGTASTTTVPPPPIVGADRLDVGPYPRAPRPPLGTAGDAATGAIAQAQQLASFVIGPWEVDDSLTTPYLSSYYVINGPTPLQQLGPEGIALAAGEHDLLYGFASAREADDENGAMVNAVLRFPDAALASAASAAMATAAVGQSIAGVTPTPTAVPGHPDAAASTYPFTPSGSGQPRATVRAFVSHGPYVFMQFVQSTDGVDAAAALVAKAFDAQGPLVDQFKAVDPSALASVPLDPTGLLAKTIPASPGEGAARNAVYQTRGAQHFQSNPIASTKLFDDNGVSEVAMGQTNVYKTKDAVTAKVVTESFNAEVNADGTTAAPSVAALPDSHCLALSQQFYCVAPAAEYAIEVRSDALPDAQQQVSAQYAMLTAK